MHPHMQIKQHPWYRGADLAAETAEPAKAEHVEVETPVSPAGIEQTAEQKRAAEFSVQVIPEIGGIL